MAAQTTQFISPALVEKAQMPYTVSYSSSVHSEEPEAEESMRLLLSIFDAMKNLCIELEKMDRLTKIINMELHNKLTRKEERNDH